MEQPTTTKRLLRRLAIATHRFSRILRRGLRRLTPSHVPIAYKFALAITVLLTAGMGLLGLLIISNQTQLLRGQMNAFGGTVVHQLAEAAQEPVLADDVLGLRVLITNLARNENILGAVVFSDAGSPLASAGVVPDTGIRELYRRAEQLNDDTYTADREWRRPAAEGGPLEVVSFIAPVRFKDVVAGHAVVTFPRTVLVRAQHDAMRAIAAATALMIALAAVMAFLMGRRLSRPIHELMDASAAIHKGQAVQFKDRRNDELGHLMSALNDIGQGLLEKSQVEAAFSRFVSTSVAKQILGNLEEIRLGGQHARGSVLFADIVGFTSMSEKLPPEEVAQLLNEYFSYISVASKLYRGNIDKFMGDCAMLVFGVPEEDPEHPFHAIACAVLIQRLVARLNAIRLRQGKFPVHFRIGVNSGEMLAGNLGAQERMQYTVVGDTVNLASRLYTAAESDQIIITEELYKHPEVEWRVLARRHESIRLRGKRKPVDTYVVKDVASTYRAEMDAQIETILSERVVA